ncbi:MAG: methyltransferase [Pirellulaceae bacterium]
MQVVRPSAEQAERLRKFFDDANYSLAGVQEVFGTSVVPSPSVANMDAMLQRTSEVNLLHTLFRMFVMGVDVPLDVAQQCMNEAQLQLLVSCGMLEECGQSLRPLMSLIPFEDLLVASDSHQRLVSDEFFDYVLALNPTARHLYEFAIRTQCDSALDLCAGCGVHALGLSTHARQVTTTDLNERAAEFIQFNAALNGRTNIRSVSGDGYAALQGEKFDLIACNPPFVMSPSKEFLYRDNELDLDQFVQDLLVKGPDHLVVGGFFQMILEWVEVQGQTWQERLSSWFKDVSCDVLVLKANSELPESYARRRVQEMHEGAPGDYSAEIQQWLDYYRQFNVRGIHGGMIALRRRDQPGWFRVDEVAQGNLGPFGDYVLAAFAAEDFLRTHVTTEAVLESRLTANSGLRLLQQSAIEDGQWAPVESIVRFSGGWHAGITIDKILANCLPLFDGQRTVAEINKVFAEWVQASPEQTAAEFCGGVREFVRRGALRVGEAV